MGFFWGVLAWVTGMVLFTVFFQWLSRANPGEKIPFFGHPPYTPGRAYVLLVLAIVLLVMSFSAWSDAVGNWSIGLYLVALIPAVVVIRRHNRGVRA